MGQPVNRQNQHMLERLNAAQRAVRQLIDLGMTVTHIDIESSMPNIQIQRAPTGKAAQKIRINDARTITRSNSMGVRESVTTFAMNGCRITWSKPQ